MSVARNDEWTRPQVERLLAKLRDPSTFRTAVGHYARTRSKLRRDPVFTSREFLSEWFGYDTWADYAEHRVIEDASSRFAIWGRECFDDPGRYVGVVRVGHGRYHYFDTGQGWPRPNEYSRGRPRGEDDMPNDVLFHHGTYTARVDTDDGDVFVPVDTWPPKPSAVGFGVVGTTDADAAHDRRKSAEAETQTVLAVVDDDAWAPYYPPDSPEYRAPTVDVPFRVTVAAWAPRESGRTGAFVLRVTDGPDPRPTHVITGRSIAVPKSGPLTEQDRDGVPCPGPGTVLDVDAWLPEAGVFVFGWVGQRIVVSGDLVT